MKPNPTTLLALAAAYALTLAHAHAAAAAVMEADAANEAAAELVRKLSNPVASLVSVPMQNNFDFGGGPNDDGFRYTLNLQPVVPFKLNDEWNLISRTIVPFVHQENFHGTTTQSGLSDITQSLFFTPAKFASDAWMWGAGPVVLLPTATDDRLGTEKFGLGPSVVVLRQRGGWTYGGLVNHVWSVAGNDARSDVSATFLNPFVSYATKTRTTFTLQTEATYDWENSQWTVPVSASVSQLLRIGKQPLSLSLGLRYYADKPAGGPDWGLRLGVTFLFPK